MESTKQKTIRSKSLNNQRVSIRRKSSFNKVRLLFENNSKTSQTNRHSDTLLKKKTLEELGIQSKYDSLKVIEENGRDVSICDKRKAINFSKSDSSFQLKNVSNDENLNEKSSDSRLVKKKIYFFENKLSDKSCEHKTKTTINVNKEYKISDNFANVCRNRDKSLKSYQLNDDCNRDKKSEELHLSNEAINKELTNSDNYLIGSNDLQQTVTHLPNSELNYRRSLSTTSVSSLASDFVSFDSEPEIVFRKPVIETSQIIKTKPIPKQRTSLTKTNENNGIKNNHLLNKTNEWLTPDIKQNEKSERISILSQDSGISDASQNSSFLWQKNFDQNSDENPNDKKSKTSAITDTEIQLLSDDQQIYEHIYEELVNCRSLSPNEWIDIENDCKTDIQITPKSEHFLNRRSQNFRSINNNYRISFRPKLHKRRTNKTSSSLIKSSDESIGSSGSATEYEDIEEDEHWNLHNDSLDSNQRSKLSEVNTIEVDSHNYHIYELMSDQKDIHIRDSKQANDNKPIKPIRKSDQKNNPNNSNNGNKMTDEAQKIPKVVSESKSNIYSSTPRRLPIIESNINRLHNKRDSMVSRNSSIYINPNNNNSLTDYFNENIKTSSDMTSPMTSPLTPFNSITSKSRTKIFENQLSITSSIASYLELNINSEDHWSPFNGEPLYQFYQNDVRRRAQLWIHFDKELTDSEYDDYENNAIYGTTSYDSSNDTKNDDQISCDRIHTLCKRNISTMNLVGSGPTRSLWCHLPQVINSKDNLLSTLSDKEKRFQESMYEIIASEASYCKSLNILFSHFYNCIEFCENNPQILSLREKKCLFSNIVDISKISSNLLKELEKRFEQNILLYDICDIVYDYAVNHFQPYIHYCAYQRDQEKLLTKLTQSRTAFVDIIQRLESNQICQNQSLLSFLMLPMQRITRYPLLIDAVSQQLPPDSPILDSVHKALAFVNQLVRKCNEETKKVQRMQELIEIEKILHFRSKIKSYPIVSGARYLVKKGSVLRLTPQLSAKKTIGKSTLKWRKSQIHLFLFSDLLILAKKKSENNYSVFDYCSRNTVQLISLTNTGEGIGLMGNSRIMPRNYGNLVQLIFLHNHESKSVEYTISFELESEKLRWIEAVSQPSSDNPNEVIYEEWDCPQVQCIRSYLAQQTDEITLEETDVLNVSRKMRDGWFEGQRIRDGVKGWFPSSHTEEIVNQHVRARNMRLRHRLLMYTQSVIQSKEQHKR